jgi:hypothetical protein
MYCGKDGHLMFECIYAAQFLDKVSMKSCADEEVPDPDIEVDATTPTDVYESLTDGQIDSLIPNPNLWMSGQTALYRHEANIYMKVTVVEALKFDPMSKAPPAYVVNLSQMISR